MIRAQPATDPASLDLAAARLAGDADVRLREQAAVALGVKGQPAVVAPLVAALADPSWEVACCAAVSLGKSRQPEALAPLIELRRTHPDWRLRGAAVVGMGHLYAKEAIPPIIAALEDEEGVVRRSAHEYLLSLAAEEPEPTVEAWTAWWQKTERFLQLYDPEERKARAEKFGYGISGKEEAAALYRGMDVVVLLSRGDHIESVLDFLEVGYRTTEYGRTPEAELHARAVFVANCSGEIGVVDVGRLGWFVRVGGYFLGSCWALHETVERFYPGVVRKLPTMGEVLDDVTAAPCSPGSPYLRGVFDDGVRPRYALEGAHLIEVLEPEACEVLVDSPECADRWGGGDLAVWFPAGHGMILDSVNHFDEQGLTRATHLKKAEQRQAYAVDHLGLRYEELRQVRKEKFWSKNHQAAQKIRDLSVFRIISNFVRLKRVRGEG